MSLSDKTDKLVVLIKDQHEYQECNVPCFTETRLSQLGPQSGPLSYCDIYWYLLKQSHSCLFHYTQLKGKKGATSSGVGSKQKVEPKNQLKKSGVNGINGGASVKRNNSSKCWLMRNISLLWKNKRSVIVLNKYNWCEDGNMLDLVSEQSSRLKVSPQLTASN